MNPPNHEKFLKMIDGLRSDPRSVLPRFSGQLEKTAEEQGLQAAYNYLMRTEAALRLRKPTLAIYDHAFHLIGGAQKYGLTLTSVLQDRFDVTIIANKDVDLRNFMNWYGLDLASCRIKVVKIPFYEEKNAAFLDPAFITQKIPNPFHRISKESGNYDVFVNNSMNEMVYPLSPISIMICHFPERRPKSYFYSNHYDRIVYNSRYTAEWIEKSWKFAPHEHIYPPVDMDGDERESPKKKIILSVARFEPEGTKRQQEMIDAFMKFNRIFPGMVKDWKLILAGGSGPENRYLTRLEGLVKDNPSGNIELRTNIPAGELKTLYREASLFWHLCGVIHNDPSEVEHFGMTVVEAMQNGAVPIVYDGGGLREIVDHGENGFRVRTKAELLETTVKLFRDPQLVQRLGEAARKKAREFSRSKFEGRVRTFFDRLLDEYCLLP